MLWEVFVVVRDIKPFLLPKPSAIWDADHRQPLAASGRRRRRRAPTRWSGCSSAPRSACWPALVASRFRIVGELATPLAAAVNAMPIIALAPILNNMFSSTSAYPRRLVVTIIVFFPIFVNTLRGLTQVDATKQELMRSYAASDWDDPAQGQGPERPAVPVHRPQAGRVARRDRGRSWPSTSAGSRTVSAAASRRPRPPPPTTAAWAYVAAAIVLGLVFYLAVNLLERLVLPWQVARRSRGEHPTITTIKPSQPYKGETSMRKRAGCGVVVGRRGRCRRSLVAAACGSDDDSGAGATTTAARAAPPRRLGGPPPRRRPAT